MPVSEPHSLASLVRPSRTSPITKLSGLLEPHRLILLALFIAGLVAAILLMDWSWLPRYLPKLWEGLQMTLIMLFSSVVVGFLFALPLGLAQVSGVWPLRWLATGFCTVIRGTPLLLQLWLFYFGLGALFGQFPEIRDSWAWTTCAKPGPMASSP